MSNALFIYIFFFYGLAFFCMGLAILIELGRSTEERLRFALPALAIFGLLHGAHEWYEMFQLLNLLPRQEQAYFVWEALRMAILVLSFLSLAIFGVWMFAKDRLVRRTVLLVPFLMIAVWGIGLFALSSRYPAPEMIDIIDVWTRYTFGIPSALLASFGLVFQQREMRRQGMLSFGRDCLWASIAFFWYGLIGQSFTRASALPPSTFWNNELFLDLFAFPVQLLRAVVAILAAVFIIRFLRLFEVENQNRILHLQEERLQEARHRETIRGEMLGRIVAAQEAERQRIARELHDATGQSLTALGLGLRSVSTNIHHDLIKAETNLRHLETMVGATLEELQSLIADLRPSHLDDLGLPSALRWYASEIQKRAPVRVRVSTVGDCENLQPEVNIAVFRIVQEALTNVVKHSQASHAKVFLELNTGDVKLVVEDDGCGFDPMSIDIHNRQSWGIMGMRERTTLLGGEFFLYSQPEWGTRIEVHIPCSRKVKEVADGDENPVSG